MSRKYIDCRDFTPDHNCSVAISADREQELIDATVQHVVSAHNALDSPQLRAKLALEIREGEPLAFHPHPEEKAPGYLVQELADDE